MSDYHTKKHKLIDAVSAELQHLRPHEIEKVLRYCRTLASQQPSLFAAKQCVVCGRELVRPRRGPMPKFCSNRCRQKNHWESVRAGGEV